MFLEIIVASLNSCPCAKVPNMPNILVPEKMLKCVFRCFQNVVAGLNLCSSLEVPSFPTHQTVGVWHCCSASCTLLGIASISPLSGISCRENQLPTCFANYLGNSTGPDTTKSAML